MKIIFLLVNYIVRVIENSYCELFNKFLELHLFACIANFYYKIIFSYINTTTIVGAHAMVARRGAHGTVPALGGLLFDINMNTKKF